MKIRIKNLILVLFVFLLCSCSIKGIDIAGAGRNEIEVIENNDEETNTDTVENNIEETNTEVIENNTTEINDNKEETVIYKIRILDEGEIIYNYNQNVGYSYGPSIIKNEDGSYDAWFSSPGNSGSQWDWITYRHSEDGMYWSDPEVVLRPTPGSKDSCSVCDPGVVYFNGYYYLAYSSTNDVNGGGFNNSAFVARSEYPDGPFEKWNGEGWGGDPEPFIVYEGDPKGWGVGEVSFVINDNDLYIYYSSIDLSGGCIDLMKADLVDDWPATVRYKGIACSRDSHDSVDVVYSEETENYYALSVDFRLSETSKLLLLESKDGREFSEVDFQRNGTQDYAHNVGIAKTKEGHIESNDDILIGYAFGPNWGRWSTIMQKIRIETIVE